jgi:hypothetical protein
VPADFARVLRSTYFVARHRLAAKVTPDAARLLGRPPTGLQQFIRDHRDLWLDGPIGAVAARAAIHPRSKEQTMTTISATPRGTTGTPAAARPLWLSALMAGVLAAAVNAAIFAAAVAAGLFPALRLEPAAGAQMAVEPVVLVSLVGAAAGVGAFGLLRRRVAEPVRAFLWLAGAVLRVAR